MPIVVEIDDSDRVLRKGYEVEGSHNNPNLEGGSRLTVIVIEDEDNSLERRGNDADINGS